VVRDTARRVVDDTPEPDLDLAAEPKRIPAFVIWGLERVNVAFRLRVSASRSALQTNNSSHSCERERSAPMSQPSRVTAC